jgi:tRNA dimethylallyltransferase
MGAGRCVPRLHHQGGSSLPRRGARLLSIFAILGPTAAAKSAVAESLAATVGAEILSVDSMQVYRGMDVGTAKPSPAAREAVPHHMIDVADPGEEYTVSRFQEEGRRALDDIAIRGRTAIVVGGSGLHFRSLVDPLVFPPTDAALRADLEAADHIDLVAELVAADPGAALLIDLNNPRRVLRAVEVIRLTGESPTSRAGGDEAHAVRAYRPLRPFRAIGLDPGDRLEARVVSRFDGMLGAGLVDEVRALVGTMGRTASQAVGYRELLPVAAGEADLATARGAVLRATFALAKRQRTFFRRDPRITWLPWQDDPGTATDLAMRAWEGTVAWIS